MNFISYAGLVSTVFAIAVAKIFHFHEVTSYTWLLLVVGVDVSHVYSSLYRTYLAKRVPPQLKKILVITPLVCFVFAFLIALKSTSFFWAVLVYIAVFHFIRQQIGFLRIFSEPHFRTSKWHLLNEIFIYTWTGGSILIWHLQGAKSFNWFTQNDFYYLKNLNFLEVPFIFLMIFTFAAATFINLNLFFKKKISSNYLFLLFSTFVSWFFPIVVYNSDFIFTAANVLAHGLTYMALVFSKEKKEKTIFSQLEIFVSLLIFLAFLEEAFWDAFIWREHSVFFESFYFLPQLAESSTLKAFMLAVLILPQLTHYILDGFIWKRKYSVS